MKLFKTTLTVIALTLIFLNTQAQTTRIGNWCHTEENFQEQVKQNPGLLQEREAMMQQIRSNIDNKTNLSSSKKASPYIIPVVVHNITHDGGVGYVTKATIEAAINRLNIDFQRLNADTVNTRALFKSVAMSMDIEFRLAHLDPNGDCTEGIVRMEDASSANFHDPGKALSFWDSKKYFNIWVVDHIDGSSSGLTLGYAQFPYSGIDATFGVVVDDTYFNATDRTLTHEVGHCFGLLHTFQSSCGNHCSNSGDRICDTPPASTDTYTCNTTQNTCVNDATGPDPYGTNVVDQIENYMSYDNCQNMFTLEQKIAMESTLNNTNNLIGLAQLSTTTNLNATGVNNPYTIPNCAPIADFTYDKEFICEGATVFFADDSYNGAPTGYNWTFTGGSPASSASGTPIITYNTAGIYGVTHRPSNSVGADFLYKSAIITVSSLTADYSAPILDGFDNSSQFSNDWIIGSGTDNYDWESSTAAMASGSRSVRLRNFTAGASSTDVDFLISPSYNLSTSSNKVIRIKVAFAQRNSSNSDKLLIYYSTTCGASWVLKKSLFAALNLVTAPVHPSLFVPTSSEWVEHSLDFTSLGLSTNLRLKFEFESDGGNDIYLDNLNIGIGVGVEEHANIGSFNVFPNPTNSSAKITFSVLDQVSNLSIHLKNSLGQVVTNVIGGKAFTPGKYTLAIDENQSLSPGIYFIEFNADNHIKTHKLIVQ